MSAAGLAVGMPADGTGEPGPVPAGVASAPPLLSLRGLVTEFGRGPAAVRAVKGVDLTIEPGRTLALIGESGSGKSVTSLSVMRLIPPGAGRIAEGQVLFRGRDGAVRDLAQAPEATMRGVRGNEIAMIFQEPMTSLNPTRTVGAQVAEAARLHAGLTRRAAWDRAVEMLRLTEIPDAARRAGAYPHQLSGGMRQRVMIAMALVCRPSLLIADEPTTALDVTVQAQILALLRRLQVETGAGRDGMGILFITHNPGVVAETADRVAVMYGGRIVEDAPVGALFARPRHPYTRGLFASVPRVDHAARAGGATQRLAAIPGQVVDPRRPPPGCEFGPRCPYVREACRAAVPALLDTGGGHLARCIRWSELDG